MLARFVVVLLSPFKLIEPFNFDSFVRFQLKTIAASKCGMHTKIMLGQHKSVALVVLQSY